MDKQLATQAPLAGIRVVDFGHYIAGPLTGMLLADQGAEVIKIDRPGKPDYDTPANAVFNRNKKKMVLDLKDPEGAGTARELIQASDVVIENFRPGVMKRLGLGPKEMTALNPRLVYLSLPGFNSADREKANIRAFEGIVGAATGLFTDLHPGMRRLLGAPPVYTPVPAGSVYGAVHGALSVVLALYDREETGKGDAVEVSLAAAAMSAMGGMMLQVENCPDRYDTRPSWLTRRLRIPLALRRLAKMSDEARQDYWRETLNFRTPLFDSFQTGDGKWIQLLVRGNRRLSLQLFKVMGIYQELIDAGMVDRPHYEDLSLDNNLQETQGLSRRWNTRIRDRMSEAFMQKPASEWVAIMNGAGVPCDVHRTTQEWLEAPEPAAAALTVTVEEPQYGALRQLGVQCTLSKTPEQWLQPNAAVPLTASPEKLWKGAAAPPVDGDLAARISKKRQILKGIRVLDLSTVLAGPCSARMLAEYGADVVKIDPPDPEFGPRVHCWHPTEVSQGKRSIILDLKTTEGMKIFQDLVRTADVIVSNMSPGTPERLGIDYQTVVRSKPDIIYSHLTAYGGPRPGPWGELKGFDPVLQAATGIQRRYAGEGHKPILHGWASCVDYLTGYCGTYGVALALFKRRRSGQGDLVTTSLAQGAQLIQAPFMYSSDTCRSADEAMGQDCLGEHSLQSIYKAIDGWLFVGSLERISQTGKNPELGATPLENDEEQERTGFLKAAIEKRPVDYWVRVLNDAGLGCHRVDCIEDIRETYLHRVEAGASVESWNDGRSISVSRMMNHPFGTPVDNVSPNYARFGNADIRLGTPMPQLGGHTRQILMDLGYSDSQIDEWESREIVNGSFHEAYLPS